MTKTPTKDQVAAAQVHARAAARLNRPVTSCPYDADGDDAQRVLARRWVRSYLHASPADAVSYDGDD